MNPRILGAILLLAVLIGAGWYLYQGGVPFISENYQSSENGEMFQIKTYKNDTYGLSFSYPETYYLEEREVGNAERFHYNVTLTDDNETNRAIREGEMSGTEGPTAITIDVFQNNLDKETLLGWIHGNGNSNFKLSIDGRLGSTTVGGVPAFLYSWDGLYRGESVVFLHKDNILMLSVTYLTPDDQIRKDFSQIISRFSLK